MDGAGKITREMYRVLCSWGILPLQGKWLVGLSFGEDFVFTLEYPALSGPFCHLSSVISTTAVRVSDCRLLTIDSLLPRFDFLLPPKGSLRDAFRAPSRRPTSIPSFRSAEQT